MMMRLFTRLMLSLLLVAGGAALSHAADAPPPGSFLALCYHNVEDSDPDQSNDGVTTSKLIEQLSWLQHEGYTAISVDDLLAARAGKKSLPAKSVLLSFDDGYESFYTRVYPVLKAFHYPAVIAVVDDWMKGNAANPSDRVSYGDIQVPRASFLTWSQIREMKKSGLIEVASHSHAMHYGVRANPQGNEEPDALSAAFDAKTGTYELASHYVKRLEDDAAASVRTIKRQTGKAPRVMVWPYGAYNEIGMMIQNQHGMPITLSLEDGYAKVADLRASPRTLIKDDPSLSDFAVQIRQFGKVQPIRVIQVDLDYVYDADPEQEARNLDQLVSRVYNMKINTVYLQAFSDPTDSGWAKEVYFPNRFLPVRQDLFNRVAWQLETRADVKVYGWLPVLSFDFGDDKIAQVATFDPATGQSAPAEKGYHRISPFDAEGRKKIIGLYEDLGRHGPIDGLLFHDDAMMSDFEDASAPALAAYEAAGFPGSIAEIRANPETMAKWTQFKTDSLIQFTQELAAHVAAYRAPLKTVRNIYAPVVLNPHSEEWFAQDYTRFLQSYDYVAVEAMPDMENVASGDQEDWMNKLVAAASAQPNGLKHTVFELQSVDWHHKDASRAIPTDKLGEEMNQLAAQGAMNFGYYPDDFIANVPDSDALHKDFSLQTYPYTP
ncbi:MAG: poly-beta-1,6-N-acetyl-D-glucosamine N-deacetylase PgaB [Alphaproteobacteria bacterium]|nr:poly-beta-1,6-N-acetyl-D-glucosamine N-deacetylase PgaB [Alphaproteobacteria bacterium]